MATMYKRRRKLRGVGGIIFSEIYRSGVHVILFSWDFSLFSAPSAPSSENQGKNLTTPRRTLHFEFGLK